MHDSKRPAWVWVTSIVAVVFGLMTIKSGGSVLFIDGEARRAAGHYVEAIVWFNFLAGFLYIATGIGIWQRRSWAPRAALLLAFATLAAFAGLGLYIAGGGAYEQRTIAAMTLRLAIWTAIAIACLRLGRGTG